MQDDPIVPVKEPTIEEIKNMVALLQATRHEECVSFYNRTQSFANTKSFEDAVKYFAGYYACRAVPFFFNSFLAKWRKENVKNV